MAKKTNRTKTTILSEPPGLIGKNSGASYQVIAQHPTPENIYPQVIKTQGNTESGPGVSAIYDGPIVEPVGTTGTMKFGGWYAEEYLSGLTGRQAALVYDEMFRSDPEVYTAIMRTLNKLKGAKFYIKPPNKDEATKKRAEKLSYCIFKAPTKKWQDNLNDLFSFLIYGFAVLEPTFRQEDHKKFGNTWCVDSFGWRNPKTIWQWFLWKDQLQAVRQISWGDDFRYVDIPGKAYIGIEDGGKKTMVPWDEVIVLSHLRFGNNLEGISPMRPMYGPYIRKDTLLKINIVGAESGARGLRVTSVDSDFLGTDKDVKLDEIQRKAAAANIPTIKIARDKMDFEFHKTDYQDRAVMESIEKEDRYIDKITQTEATGLGLSSPHGSQALGKQKGEEHDESIKNYAEYVCEKLNDLLKFLEIVNFGGQDEYCELAWEGIDRKGSKEDAEIIAILSPLGFFPPTDENKAHVAERFDFPIAGMQIGIGEIEDGSAGEENDLDITQPGQGALLPAAAGAIENKRPTSAGPAKPGTAAGPDPEEVKQEIREHAKLIKQIQDDAVAGKPKNVVQYATQIVQAHKKMAEHNHIHVPAQLKENGYRRGFTKYEKKVQFAEVKNSFVDFNQKYHVLISGSFKNYVLPKYKSDLKRALNMNEDWHKVELGKKAKVLSLVKDFLTNAVKEGRRQAINELKAARATTTLAEKGTPNPGELPAGVYGWIKKQAEYAVDTVYDKVKGIVNGSVITSQNNDATDEQTIFNATEEGEDYIDNEQNTGSAILPVLAINEGRWSSFKEMSDLIQGYEFSALLENSCELCTSLDGKTFKKDDPDSVEMTPPLHPNCNCIIVPITIDEEEPEWDGLDSIVNDIGQEQVDKLKKLSEVQYV